MTDEWKVFYCDNDEARRHKGKRKSNEIADVVYHCISDSCDQTDGYDLCYYCFLEKKNVQ